MTDQKSAHTASGRMLKLVRQKRVGKKCKSLAGIQRSLLEKDVDADLAEITAQLDELFLPSVEDDDKAPHLPPVSKPIPSHLPRAQKVIRQDTDHCPVCNEPLYPVRNTLNEKLKSVSAYFVVNHSLCAPAVQLDLLPEGVQW